MKKCNYCDKEFEGRGNKKYCSTKCYKRSKAKRSYHKRKDLGKFRLTCAYCGKEALGTRKEQKYCSNKCSGDSRRKYLDIPSCLENSDRKIDKNIGYVRVYVPMHQEANSWGYVYEHRVIAEKKIGRRLRKNEVVHHKNGIRWDNEEENLEVMDRIEHSKLSKKTGDIQKLV